MQTQPEHLSPTQQLRLQAQLLNAVDQAIIATDLDGCIVFWNRFAEKLYGWSAEEALGCNSAELIISASEAEQGKEIWSLLQKGESWSGEFSVHRRDGTPFTIYVTDSPVFDEDGTLLGIVGVSRDITNEKRVTEAHRLMAQAGLRLMSAADYEALLSTLAELAVPQLADWCAVHLVQSDGSIEQVASNAPAFNEPPAASRWLRGEFSSDIPEGVAEVMRSGEPKMVADAAGEAGTADAEVKSYMIVPLVARPHTLGAITFVAAELGRHFDQETLSLAENLASHVSVYLDRARLYRETERAKDDLERNVAERTTELLASSERLRESEATVQALFRITKKLNATLDVDALLGELAQEAIAFVHGESGFAALRTADGVTIRKYFKRGEPVEFNHTWGPGQGIPAWVLENKVPYGTSDAAEDPNMLHELSINAGVRCLICTPILDSADEVLGLFEIRNKLGGGNFTIADQDMLIALAPAASIAIQNALAYQQHIASLEDLKKLSGQLQALAARLEMAREQERTEVARELHDQLGQALTAMKFDLAWLTDRLVEKNETLPIAEKVKALKAQMDAMIKNVRRLATELRPGMLDDLGLAASIEWQARDFEKRTGITCGVSIIGEEVALPRTLALAMFRIFQEALTNAARHAKASRIEVSLITTGEALTLQVRDDGRGIRAQELNAMRSLGLIGMRERAQRLRGTFNIEAARSGGTVVTASIPLSQGEEDEPVG